ncbi:MAG: regulatory protein RecX [Xanthomonadales bacterium]|nr:regulatory protein RecX [Xanthomonadales bacterium]
MSERDDAFGAAAGGASSRPRRRTRPEPSPAQRALGLLVRREHSRKELLQKLTIRGVSTADADVAVARMVAEGWQDDGRFADSLVRSRAMSGYGPRRIRAELETHGLAAEAVVAAMEGSDADWARQARDLVRRRHPQVLANDRAAQRKAADFLLRRGYTMDQVRAATRFDPDDP